MNCARSMSEETPGRWFEIGNPSLPLRDRIVWLSLTLAVVASGVWQVAQNDFWKDEPTLLATRSPIARTRDAIDYTPTASIRRRAPAY